MSTHFLYTQYTNIRVAGSWKMPLLSELHTKFGSEKLGTKLFYPHVGQHLIRQVDVGKWLSVIGARPPGKDHLLWHVIKGQFESVALPGLIAVCLRLGSSRKSLGRPDRPDRLDRRRGGHDMATHDSTVVSKGVFDLHNPPGSRRPGRGRKRDVGEWGTLHWRFRSDSYERKRLASKAKDKGTGHDKRD